MLNESDRTVLNQIIELVKDHTTTSENINARINSIEKKVDSISYHVHGNGNPGLSEVTREIQKELQHIKEDLDNLDIEAILDEKLKEIKSSYSVKEIESIKTQLRVQWFVAAMLIASFVGRFLEWF